MAVMVTVFAPNASTLSASSSSPNTKPTTAAAPRLSSLAATRSPTVSRSGAPLPKPNPTCNTKCATIRATTRIQVPGALPKVSDPLAVAIAGGGSDRRRVGCPQAGKVLPLGPGGLDEHVRDPARIDHRPEPVAFSPRALDLGRGIDPPHRDSSRHEAAEAARHHEAALGRPLVVRGAVEHQSVFFAELAAHVLHEAEHASLGEHRARAEVGVRPVDADRVALAHLHDASDQTTRA